MPASRRKLIRCRPATPGSASVRSAISTASSKQAASLVGGALDALDHLRRHRDPRHLLVHVAERRRRADEADRGQQRGLLGEPARDRGAHEAPRGARARSRPGAGRSARPRATFLSARSTRYSNGGAPGFSTAPRKRCGAGSSVAAGEVAARRERARRLEQLRAVEVEDALRLGLVARRSRRRRSGRAGSRRRAAPRRRCPPASASRFRSRQTSCMHGLDAEQLQRDRDRERRGVRVRGRVVGRVDRVDPRLERLEALAHGVEPAAVDRRAARR